MSEGDGASKSDPRAFLQAIADDETQSPRQRMDALRMISKLDAAGIEDDRTLNRLSREELEALASRIAAERGAKALMGKA